MSGAGSAAELPGEGRDGRAGPVQALATYDKMEPDELSGERRPNTGMTAIYLGPQINLSIGENFSLNADMDIPIEIDNRGLQNVPDYRFHGGVSFRF